MKQSKLEEFTDRAGAYLHKRVRKKCAYLLVTVRLDDDGAPEETCVRSNLASHSVLQALQIATAQVKASIEHRERQRTREKGLLS